MPVDVLKRKVCPKVYTSYIYDTLGNLTLETVKNKSVDYIYSVLNQLVQKNTSINDIYICSQDKGLIKGQIDRCLLTR